MSDIFLSYASEDRKIAKELAEALERHDWTVWWDRHIPTGEEYPDVIERALSTARCVVVLWSQDSVKSDWVQNEAADARDRGLALFPAMIEEVKLPFEFRRLQAANLIGWKGDDSHPGFSALVNDLSRKLGREPEPVPIPPPPPPRPITKYLAVGGAAVVALVGIFFGLRYLIFPGTTTTPTPTPIPTRTSPSPGIPTVEPTLPRGVVVMLPPTPMPTPSATPTPDLGKIPNLFRAVSSLNQAERRKAMDTLRKQYGSEPAAVEYAASLLNRERIGEVGPQGVINILAFLNHADNDAAWNRASMQKVEAAFPIFEGLEPYPGIPEELAKLRSAHAARRNRGL